MPRQSRIDDPEFAKLVAEAYIGGMGRPEMAAEFNCHVDTITDWTKDPRVQAHASRFAQERIARIGRKIDAIIEGRLQEASDLDTDTLLKIRKEYLDRPLKIALSEADKDPNVINDTMAALEDNPEIMGLLMAAFDRQREPQAALVEGTAEEITDAVEA
jgi:transposase